MEWTICSPNLPPFPLIQFERNRVKSVYHEAVQIAEVPVGLLVTRVPQVCHTPEYLKRITVVDNTGLHPGDFIRMSFNDKYSGSMNACNARAAKTLHSRKPEGVYTCFNGFPPRRFHLDEY